MKQTKLRTLILAAMFAALTCVATMIIHIPSPIGGYFNLGDCMVLLSAFVLGPVWGTAAGGIGSALWESMVSISFIRFSFGFISARMETACSLTVSR